MAGGKHVDYAFGPGKSPTMGAINAGFAAFNATAIAYESGFAHPWLGLGIGVVAASASIGVLAADNHLRFTEGRAMCYRAACWLGAGIWSTVQLSMRPWSWTSAAVLGIGVVATAIVGTALRKGEVRQRAQAEEKIRQAAEAEAARRAVIAAAAAAAAEREGRTEEDEIAAYWQPRFRKICKLPGLVIEDVEIWPTGDGYTLGGLVPDDGSTVETNVKPHEQALATSADLQGGCNVAIRSNIPGESRRVFHGLVNTHNAMADPQQYLDDGYGNRTIHDRVRLGVAADRSVGTASLLDDSMVLIGQTGSGKSTTLNVVTAELVRCTDTLVFAIDKKGRGEYPRRWTTAWHEGRAERPAIHLVAVTDEQAELMTLGIINIVQGRPVAYAKDMMARGERKIMPTPQLPQIVLIVDEFKSLPDSVKANIELIKDQGRSAAVEVIVCALEAVGSTIPRAFIKQCRERVGMRFNDEAELQYLFDSTWKSGRFDPSSMTHPGMMLLSSDARPPMQHKAYDMPPAQIDDISIVVGRQRPPLDDVSIGLFDTVVRRVRNAKGDWFLEKVTDVYATWWDRTLPLMFADDHDKPEAEPVPVSVDAAVPEIRLMERGTDPFEALSASDSALQRAMSALRGEAQAADARAEEREADAEPDLVLTDAELLAMFDLELPARQRYFTHIREAGADGIGATRLAELLQAEGYSTVRQTISDWLVEDFGNDRLLKRPDVKGRYIWNPGQPQ